MKLFHVTITGADDLVSPVQLLELSKEFPFIEWGILFSSNKRGQPRYPTLEWVDRLLDQSQEMNLSAHFCGEYAKKAIYNNHIDLPPVNNGSFKRIQINCPSEDFHKANLAALSQARALSRSVNERFEYIFQYRDPMVDLGKAMELLEYNPIGGSPTPGCFALVYDPSGGRGITQTLWPKPLYGMRFGYAGGLNPDNLETQLENIAAVAGEETVWIDMETGVRTENIFDLQKVRQVLTIAQKYT